MQAVRRWFSVLAGTALGLVAALALTRGREWLDWRYGPWIDRWGGYSQTAVAAQIFMEYLLLFILAGVVAAMVATLVAGRRVEVHLGVIGAFLVWLLYVVVIIRRGDAALVLAVKGFSALLWATGLAGALSGGLLGAGLMQRPRKDEEEA